MNFKHDIDKTRIFYTHPLVLIIAAQMNWYCAQKGIPFTVTSSMTTLEEDNKVNRKHATHREGRAIDVSVKGWKRVHIKEFVKFFNEKYYNMAAFSASKQRPTLVIHHDVGHGEHLHIQIHKEYALNTTLR